MAVIVVAGKTSKVNGHEKASGSKDKARSIDRDDVMNHSSSRRSKKVGAKVLRNPEMFLNFIFLAPLNVLQFHSVLLNVVETDLVLRWVVSQTLIAANFFRKTGVAPDSGKNK